MLGKGATRDADSRRRIQGGGQPTFANAGRAFLHVPELKVVAPCNPAHAKGYSHPPFATIIVLLGRIGMVRETPSGCFEFLPKLSPATTHSVCQQLENRLGLLYRDAGVRDALSVLGGSGHKVLPPFHQVALDHYAADIYRA